MDRQTSVKSADPDRVTETGRESVVAGSGVVRADLHIHTFAEPNESHREEATIDAIADAAKAQGVSVIAITDHNTARRAREAAAKSDSDLLILQASRFRQPTATYSGFSHPMPF